MNLGDQSRPEERPEVKSGGHGQRSSTSFGRTVPLKTSLNGRQYFLHYQHHATIGADCFIGINQICTPRQTGARRLDPPNALLIEGLVIQERFKSALPLL